MWHICILYVYFLTYFDLTIIVVNVRWHMILLITLLINNIYIECSRSIRLTNLQSWGNWIQFTPFLSSFHGSFQSLKFRLYALQYVTDFSFQITWIAWVFIQLVEFLWSWICISQHRNILINMRSERGANAQSQCSGILRRYVVSPLYTRILILI